MADTILNAEQQQAITHKKGPILIIAGAGTGKTTVITERIKHLILNENISPTEILALTFTEKAAKEMEERVDVMMPYGYTQMWILTFHSFCDRVLRDDAIHIGLNPSYRLATEAESILFLRKHLFELKLSYFRPLGNPYKFLHGMIQHFSRLKDEDISTDDYLTYAETLTKDAPNLQSEEIALEAKKTLELARAYKIYAELKVKEGIMDFSDLISNTLLLFRKRKNILQNYQERFKYILVDEFQDTNFAQNQLALLLSGNRRNITVVGDDDQCLPKDTVISTISGRKKIKDIKEGDILLTGIGKGSVGTSRVAKVMKSYKKTTFITLITESGQTITATHNHKMFCYAPKAVSEKNFYYVYLMCKKNLGWRLGVTNDLNVRIKLERSSDLIVGLRAFTAEQEAKYHETLWSLHYQIPTCIFKEKERVMIQEEYVRKLHEKFDTEENAKRLAKDLNIDLRYPHYLFDSVTRGSNKRVKINIYLCHRNYIAKQDKERLLKHPSISHSVRLETTNHEVIKLLIQHTIPFVKTEKGVRVRYTSANIQAVGDFAKKLQEITAGFIETTSTIGTLHDVNMPAVIIPASNLLEGLYIPILKRNKIYYDKIVRVERQQKKDTVYDLEIERTHNFIANNVVVHNSIYRWRGAAVSNMIQFTEHFKNAKIITLTKNYRSTEKILRSSYRLIQHNNPDRLEAKEHINKKLTEQRKRNGKQVELQFSDRVEDEAERVTHTIKELIQKNQYEYKDIALLVRANDHAHPFARSFERNGIPFQFLGPGRLFHQEEIKDLIAYLKVLYNFDDTASLYRVLSSDIFGIFPRDIAAILNFARRFNMTFFETLEHAASPSDKKPPLSLSESTKEKVTDFVAMIHRHLARVPKDTAGQILYYFLEDCGLLQKLLAKESSKDEKQYLNISRFFDKLKTFEAENQDASIFAVVDWIDLSMQMGESPFASDTDWTENNAVNLLTIHSSKGLEFPVVFLVNLVSQRFPTRERREQIPIPQKLIKEILPSGDYHLQEERRLCYVGMTRAKDRLFLTAANFYGEGKRERKLSPFIYEALGEKTVEAIIQKEKTKSLVVQQSLLDWSQPMTKPFITDRNGQQPINYLSYSQIRTFTICPLHYKLKYLLKLPSTPTASQSFGTSIHSTLRDFYQLVMQKNHPTADVIKTLLEKNWMKEGYKNKDHEKEAFERGRSVVLSYLQKYYLNDISASRPIALELPFQFFLRSQSTPRALKIVGRIDRIDKIDDRQIEIIDYKTGNNIPGLKELEKDLQLNVYALAAVSVNDARLRKNPSDILLSLFYLEEDTKLTISRTQEQLDLAKEEIFTLAKHIEKSDFTCSRSMLCEDCEYKMLCKI